MPKKSKFNVISINYQNEDGTKHEAVIAQEKKTKTKPKADEEAAPYGACTTIGEVKCYEGDKYICINVFGSKMWSKSLTEKC